MVPNLALLPVGIRLPMVKACMPKKFPGFMAVACFTNLVFRHVQTSKTCCRLGLIFNQFVDLRHNRRFTNYHKPQSLLTLPSLEIYGSPPTPPRALALLPVGWGFDLAQKVSEDSVTRADTGGSEI